ncbi:unnamed protein product [Camellia sinensis]
MGGAQAMNRIPRIKFPQRHSKPSGSTSQHQEKNTAGNSNQTLFSRSSPSNVTGGGGGGGESFSAAQTNTILSRGD